MIQILLRNPCASRKPNKYFCILTRRHRLEIHSMRNTLAALTLCLLTLPVFAKGKNEVVVPLKTSTEEDAATATFQQEKSKPSIKLHLNNFPLAAHRGHCPAP